MYKLTESVTVPVRYNNWNEKLGKNVHQKKYLKIWKFPELDDNMIILGRDGMKILKMKIYDESELFSSTLSISKYYPFR